MQKFKVGDKVKVVKNSYGGYWQPGENQILTVKEVYTGHGWFHDIDVEGQLSTGRVGIQTYHPDDLELIQVVEE